MNGKFPSISLKSRLWTLSLILSIFFTPLLPVSGVLAESHLDTPPLIGVVKKIVIDKALLVIKTDEGERRSIVFTEKTTYKGVLAAEEMKPKQKVKVWYVLEGGLVKALKIEVMPELGC